MDFNKFNLLNELPQNLSFRYFRRSVFYMNENYANESIIKSSPENEIFYFRTIIAKVFEHVRFSVIIAIKWSVSMNSVSLMNYDVTSAQSIYTFDLLSNATAAHINGM